MKKTRMITPIFLLVLGIIAITLVGSAAGNATTKCLDNQKSMMIQQSSIENCQDNKAMNMVSDNLNKESCDMAGMGQNEVSVQDRLIGADFWLEKAIKLHEMHIKKPSTATNESQMEMMDQMMRAHEYIAGENVTMGMTDKTAHNISAISIPEAEARLMCTDLWLEQAIELHMMHLMYPNAATKESQMEMMEQMKNAHERMMGKGMDVEMTGEEGMECAKASMKTAMELHMLHMKEHGTATNESQMKTMEQMMGHMMQAREYMNKENKTMEMTDKERMNSAGTSLKNAMEMHQRYMNEYGTTDESHMLMMEQMMGLMAHAYEHMAGNNMTLTGKCMTNVAEKNMPMTGKCMTNVAEKNMPMSEKYMIMAKKNMIMRMNNATEVKYSGECKENMPMTEKCMTETKENMPVAEKCMTETKENMPMTEKCMTETKENMTMGMEKNTTGVNYSGEYKRGC